MHDLNYLMDKVNTRVATLQPEDRFHKLPQFQFIPAQNGDTMCLAPLDEKNQADVPTYEISPHAWKQMAARMNSLPAQYIENLPAEFQWELMRFHMHFKTDEGNRHRYDKALMFRGVVGHIAERKVRAVMSDKFQPFDDVDLFPAVYSAFGDFGLKNEVEVKMSQFDELTTHVRFIWGQEQVLTKGEIVRRSLHVTNSEVGGRSVTIIPAVYVVACANGMLSTKEMGNIRHVGNEFRLKRKVKDALSLAIGDVDRLSAQFAESAHVRLENPVNVLEHVQKMTNMTQDQFKRTIGFFGDFNGGRTKFDLVQSITRSAQEEDDTESRFQMERVGAKALDMKLEKYDG